MIGVTLKAQKHEWTNVQKKKDSKFICANCEIEMN